MTFDPNTASLNELRQIMGEVIRNNPNAAAFWDLITCLRGPDSPSERGDMTPAESSEAYHGRRERKAKTVEVIRAQAFFGAVGGAARYRTDRDWVELPPRAEWDHFDKHVERAANAIGLEVRMVGKNKWAVKAEPMTDVKFKLASSVVPAKMFDADFTPQPPTPKKTTDKPSAVLNITLDDCTKKLLFNYDLIYKPANEKAKKVTLNSLDPDDIPI